MREICSHKVNGLNQALKVDALDDPGIGGANHVYMISPADGTGPGVRIVFQNGPLEGSRPNGLSNEALLAIVEDRLIGFQSGQFACRENAVALTNLQESMMWLQKRTRDRMARGVEGTSVK